MNRKKKDKSMLRKEGNLYVLGATQRDSASHIHAHQG